jgi:outer membrane protein TolC
MKKTPMRQFIAGLIVAILPASLRGQQTSFQSLPINPEPPQTSRILRPYLAPNVPPLRPGNSPRLADLIRAGALYLTAQDAVALALENNIDIEVSRYDPVIAQWRVTRSDAGGPLPGVPSGASQAGSVASGQGVVGSQQAAGVNTGTGGGGRGSATNATISQVGPVVQTLDPSFQSAATFSHTSTPQPNATQSSTSNLIANSRAFTNSFKNGFLSGGNLTLGLTEHYLNENAPTDVLNPSVAPSLSLSIQHNLLSGFGIAVNSRNITVSKIGVDISELNFRNRVSSITAQVLSIYYSLAANNLDLRAKQTTLDTAREFEETVRRQIEFGATAPSGIVTARSQVVSAEQGLADSRATLQKQELQLKNLLSRTGTADPLLRGVRIVLLDQIAIPENDGLAPFEQLVQTALDKRPDLAVNKANEQSSEISALGTRNGLRPTLQATASTSQVGLAGTPRPPVTRANPYFIGGLGTALGQVIRRNFANESGGAVFFTSLGNHTAQADYAIDQLQLRQTQLANSKGLAQVQVDILNATIALQQARAQFDAATHNRTLQEQLLAAEQTKYGLGSSTPFTVAQQQRDLVNVQSQELGALVAYSQARLDLEVTMGTILDTYHVSIGEAIAGTVARKSQVAP